MNGNAKFEAEVLSLLSQLKTKKETLETQYKTDLAAIDQEIEAVSTTARLLRQNPTASAVQSMIRNTWTTPALAGKTIKQGCIEIAKRNNGIVRVREAKDALMAAGVVRHTKNSWGIVNTTLLRAKEFEKHPTEQGAFRLIESTQSRLSSVA